jgi:hypothetical protein
MRLCSLVEVVSSDACLRCKLGALSNAATRAMSHPKTFSKPVLSALHATRIIGIRAGIRPHRFIGIWVVVVGERVFVRPWNDKPGGWHRAFLAEPRGTILIGEREVRVRASKTRGDRLMDAVDRAYMEKYTTPASRKYVAGFARPSRRLTTVELRPR